MSEPKSVKAFKVYCPLGCYIAEPHSHADDTGMRVIYEPATKIELGPCGHPARFGYATLGCTACDHERQHE